MIQSVVMNVQYLIHNKRPSNELINAILLVWHWAYERELLKSHVYPDVMLAFKRWRNDYSIKIFTYSNDDSYIQKMLFAHTLNSNLNIVFLYPKTFKKLIELN